MELKVWVEGIQRIVCGVTEKTTCQDVVYALAHATGKTGRFTLIERWRNNERLLAPQEHPLKVLNKWGEYSQDVQFILQRSALDGLKSNATAPTGAPIVQGGNLMSPQLQRANFGGVPGPPAPINNQPGQIRGSGVMTKAQSAEPPAVWKPPPPHGAIAGIPGSSALPTTSSSSSLSGMRGMPSNNNQSQHPSHMHPGGVGMHRNTKSHNTVANGQSHNYPNDISSENVPNGVQPLVGSSRLSPDSGRGSDKTGSDTSNSYSDKDNHQRNAAPNGLLTNTKTNSSAKLGPAGQNPQANNPSQPSHNPSFQSANGLPTTAYGPIQRSASATQMAWNRSGTPNNPNMYCYDNNPQSFQHANNIPNGISSNNINQNHISSESPYGFTKQSSMPVLGHPSQQYFPPNSSQQSHASSSQQMMPPPAYRPPPGPHNQAPMPQGSGTFSNRNSSPADPPPYRDPPPPPGVRFRPPMPSSPTNMPGARLQNQQQGPYRPNHYQAHQSAPTSIGGNSHYVTQPVRPPHYSPPPTHRVAHLSRHPSKTSLVGANNLQDGTAGGSRSRQINQDQRLNQYQTRSHPNQHYGGNVAAIKNKHKAQQQHLQHTQTSQGSLTDMNELLTLVTAQQSTLQSQQADIRQYETEEHNFDGHNVPSNTGGISRNTAEQMNGPDGGDSLNDHNGLLSPGSQLDLVLSEVRRLEEMSNRNDEELKFLNSERAQMDNQMISQQQNAVSTSSNSSPLDLNDSPVDENIRGEILQLKHRLAGTDLELQRTNTTLRRLGDEMRNMSLEKTRQREQELVVEIERLQSEIKSLQKSSEDSANISQQLSKDVKDVEDQIRARKAEVEQLIKEMREANMESLAISPPEESKQFLDGPPKPGSSRKMMGSPRQLENAVPTSRNPHGVWV